MKKILLTIACATFAALALAANIPVREFRYAGPFPVKTPFMVDTVNVNSKAFEFASLLDTPLSGDVLKDSGIYTASDLPLSAATDAIHLIEFSFQNSGYTTATIKVEGVKDYKINVDGKDGGANLKLQPFTHKVRRPSPSRPRTTPRSPSVRTESICIPTRTCFWEPVFQASP